MARLSPAETQVIEGWTATELATAIALMFVAWGRGRDARAEMPWLKLAISASPSASDLDSSEPCFNEVAAALSHWCLDYNEQRSHSPLGYQTPLEFATALRLGKTDSKVTDITKEQLG